MTPEQETLFRQSWAHVWQDLTLAAPDEVMAALLAGYAEPHRHYHSQQHLAECLTEFAALRQLCQRPGAVGLALWFHDAIYDPQAHDNEARSATWVANVLRHAGADENTVETVTALIMATAHTALPAGGDAAILVDIDLSILAAAPERFAEYERQVRAEYHHVPAEAFRLGRRQVLLSFLQRPVIYYRSGTDPVFAAKEARARHNLEDSLARLALPASD